MPQALRATSDEASDLPVVALVRLSLACEVVLAAADPGTTTAIRQTTSAAANARA
jgi:hypothetical protein